MKRGREHETTVSLRANPSSKERKGTERMLRPIHCALITSIAPTLAACSGAEVGNRGNGNASSSSGITGAGGTVGVGGTLGGSGGTQHGSGGVGGAGSVDADAATSDVAIPTGPIAIKLDIPPRIEWNSGVGFCGEASIQTIALYYGAWISQYKVRAVAGGPVVFGTGSETVLTALHFNFDAWDFAGPTNPQF